MDTTKLVEEACPIISDLGWTFYFTPSTIARGEQLGLDAFGFYFLGRGGVLGDVEAPVVASAFGYFNPAVLASMWDAGRAKVAPRDAARAFIAAAHEFGREKLSSLDETGPFARAARAVFDAARERAEGLSLFAAVAAEPVPDDPAAAAMHLLMALREYRGSAHLVAIVASGVEPRTAHFMRRPAMYATFGWSDDEQPAVTGAETAGLRAADELTDRIVAPAYGVLDDDEAFSLLAGLHAFEPVLGGIKIPGT